MSHHENRGVLVAVSAEVRGLAERTLAWRFELTRCATAEEALSWLSSIPFAAVVCDQGLPGSRGVDLLAHVAAHAPDAARILLTRETDLRAALSAPGTAFVTKPIDPARLLAEVENGVSQFNALAAVRRSAEHISSAAQKIRRATPLLGTPVVKRRT